VLAVFWYRLMHRYATEGATPQVAPPLRDDDSDESRPLSFAY